MKLENHIALLTGAGQGVGQGIALALARHGGRVAAFGRTASKLEETRAKIEGRGGEGITITGDVKNSQALEDCVSKVVDHFGGPQILVNNAQEVPLGPLLQVSEEAIHAG